MSDVTVAVFHNPACGRSRNTLALICNNGVKPVVVEYLKTPPSRAKLVELVAAMGKPVRNVLRQKRTPYDEMNLGDAKWTDDRLINLMVVTDPDEPVDRRDAPGHPLVPPVGDGARHAAVAAARARYQGRRRTGHRCAWAKGRPPCRSLT